MSYYLSIDLGTTGCRSIIFDAGLNDVGSSYREYGLITLSEKQTEQDAELWWELSLATASEAIKRSGIDAKKIKSISISSQGITLVPVDKSFKPLRNAISWLDTRAEDEAERIEKEFGRERMYTLTGKNITSSSAIAKLLWLREHEREVYDSAYKFLMPLDFLIARFTGNPVTDRSMASGILMYDIKNGVWCKEILDFYSIDENKLPLILNCGDIAGKVLPEVREKLCLSAECVVAVGAQDQKCAAYGAGLSDGVMTVSLGTAAAITKLWHEAKTDVNCGVGWSGYAEKELFVTEGVVSTAGTCLRWVRDNLYKDEGYSVIDAEADQSLEKGSSLIFIPYMNGMSEPFAYPDSCGCFYGISLATVRGDIALSVMEGVAFQIRLLLETMEAYKNVHTLILFGGGAKSRFWSQLIADITGLTLKVPTVIEAAGAGAAMLAAKAVGDTLPPLCCAGEYAPTERSKAYNEKYKTFRSVITRLFEKED